MARQDTASAWFCVTNSWLSTAGLLFFLRSPMALPAAGARAAQRLREGAAAPVLPHEQQTPPPRLGPAPFPQAANRLAGAL